MPPMTSKLAKWLLWTGIIAVLLVSAVSIVTAFVLPAYVENHLLPGLGKEFGLSPGEIRVRRIGLWGSDLGPIHLMSNGASAVHIAAVQIDYSPWGLVQGNINGLTVVGLGIPILWTPDGVSIAGVRLPKASATSEDGAAALDLRTLLPIQLKRMAIVQSHLTLEVSGRRYLIPFDIELATHRLAAGHLKGRADLSILGNAVILQASLDQKADAVHVEMNSTGFQMAAIEPFVPSTLPVQLKGRMDIEGRVQLGLRSFDLKGLVLSAQFIDIQFATPHGVVRPVTDGNGHPQPISASLTGDGLSEIRWRFSPFQITGPAVVAVDELSGILAHKLGNWTLNGEVRTVVAEQLLAEGVRIPSKFGTTWGLTCRRMGAGGPLMFDLTDRESSAPLAMEANDIQLTAKHHTVRIAGSLNGGLFNAESTISAQGIQIASPAGKMMVPEMTISSRLAVPATASDESATVEIQATAPGIRAATGTTAVHLPETTLKAIGRAIPRQPWHFDARIHLSKGRITDKARQLQVRNLSVELPLKWPETGGVPPGRLNAAAVEWNKRSVGGVKGTIQQKRYGLDAVLRHSSKLFPGMRVLFNGRIERTGVATVAAEVPRYHLTDKVNLGRILPAISGVRVSGQIEAAGDWIYDNGALTGDARFQFNQGRLHLPEQNLLLEGIDVAMKIDDFEKIQSAPQQKLRVKQLSFGKLNAQNLSVDFQLEHPSTVFIEKAQVDWSEGKINTAALRVIPGVDEYDVILFCDRLNLAMVLEQLGAAQADGDGTVNGRIPIHWANGRLHFDNGFLYSSPGQTGAIQITGTEVLLSGLPPGTPQYAQLDIATEALKDYTYKWAKMNVQTEDDILLLKLQFDGKPNRLLPFAYDQSIGQFKRIVGEGQADFKGISIDLNLRSPLNEILNYKEILK